MIQNEGCTGIVISFVCVIGDKKTKSKRFKVLSYIALEELAASTFMI
jgi:hypothetical protein